MNCYFGNVADMNVPERCMNKHGFGLIVGYFALHDFDGFVGFAEIVLATIAQVTIVVGG